MRLIRFLGIDLCRCSDVRNRDLSVSPKYSQAISFELVFGITLSSILGSKEDKIQYGRSIEGDSSQRSNVVIFGGLFVAVIEKVSCGSANDENLLLHVIYPIFML